MGMPGYGASRPLRAIALGLSFLLLVAGLAIGGFWFWLRTALPPDSLVIVSPQTGAPITITRDRAGLPTIVAPTENDAAFGLGYVHAQDRLFQMDAMRRYGEGRLSEWFGRPTLADDRFMRTLGLTELVAKQYRLLPKAVRDELQSYADGVNAYASGDHALPPEYYVLNTSFEPWRPEDSLIWAKLMDLQLTGNFKDELLHAELIKRFSPDELGILFPAYPSTAPVVLPKAKAALRDVPVKEIYASLPAGLGPFEASNSWAVSGFRSISGKPMLANDPHLGFSIPSAWYLARLKTPSDTVTGATTPGNPFVLIGHNTQIAWGITATRSDVEDIFIEKIDNKDPTQYKTPDGPRPFGLRRESISVRGEAPVRIVVRTTRHGPVISDLAGFAEHVPSKDYVLSLQASWLTSEDTSPEAVWDLSRAHNWGEFRNALRKLTAPQLNFVYADVKGNIGFIAPAKIPTRKKGDGWLPVPGWNGEYDWTGYVPFAELPAALNPPSGAIASANNKPDDRDQPFLARDWIPPYRAERITKLLAGTTKLSIKDMEKIQFDTVSLAARQLTPSLSVQRLKGAFARHLAQQLKLWNGRMAADRIEPLVFSAWLRELTRALLQPRLGKFFREYGEFHPDVVYLILTKHRDWCDDPATPQIETCDDQVDRSFEMAVSKLRRTLGDRPEAWRWGGVHKAIYSHPLWSRVPMLAHFLNYRLPADGSTDTVNNAHVSFRYDKAPYYSFFGSTLRMMVDLSNLDNARFMMAPGQSGNPLSRHYDDLIDGWQQHRWLKFQKQ